MRLARYDSYGRDRTKYCLWMSAYSGCPSVFVESENREGIRDAASRWLRLYRNEGREIITLESGSSWEILEPSNAVLIDDSVGVLSIREPILFEDDELEGEDF